MREVLNLHRRIPGQRVNDKLVVFEVMVREIEREYPDPVSALLALATVGVEDPQLDRPPLFYFADRSEENPVATHPEMPVAHQPHGLRHGREVEAMRIDDNVVVAQGLVPGEIVDGPTSRLGRPEPRCRGRRRTTFPASARMPR